MSRSRPIRAMSGQTAHIRIGIHERNGERMLMKFRNIFYASGLATALAICVPHPVIAVALRLSPAELREFDVALAAIPLEGHRADPFTQSQIDG